MLGGGVAYTGGTTVNAGVLELEQTTNFNSAITNNATVDLYSTDAFATRTSSTFADPFTVLGGTVTKTGSGEVRFDNAVTMTGQVDIEAGVLGSDALTADWSGTTADVDISSGAYLDLRAEGMTIGALRARGRWKTPVATV